MAKPCVVMGITGGIAAYKSAQVVSQLVQRGVDVYVIMTEHATHFIGPLTLETLSGHPVVTDMFNREAPWEVEHISLAKRADVFLIAPATANIIGKMAAGIADDMLSTTVMATRAKVLLAPAMNSDMYEHPAMEHNLALLKQRGCRFIGPGAGRLACGDVGPGRMSDPEDIVEAVMALLHPRQDMAGLRVLVTAGPTREPIDPVRYISNRSSGKMGYAIARQALARGADVTLVSGPVDLGVPEGARIIQVETAAQMREAVLAHFDECDVAIKAAAVADYAPAQAADHKLKKDGTARSLEMVPNPDIAAELGSRKKGQTLVIFAAETEAVLENARKKLLRKNADLMVANDVTQPGAGFALDTNIVTLIDREGKMEALPQLLKTEVADRILDAVLRIRAGKGCEATTEA